MPTRLNFEIITAAIEGFEQQKRHIDTKIAELLAVLTGGPATPAATPEAPIRKRKKFSAVARRKMALAQKARWAKIRGGSEPPAPTATELPKPKRKPSAAGRRAISEATKKRWALKRAEAVKAERATKKSASARKKAAA